jgi:hypothetical protein
MDEREAEAFKAAIVVEMVKDAGHMQTELFLPAQAVGILRRILEEPDYRAVAIDVWREAFVNQGEAAEILRGYLSKSKEYWGL